MTKQYRIKCYKFKSTWWRDSFIAPWRGPDGKAKAELYLRKIQADEKAARP